MSASFATVLVLVLGAEALLFVIGKLVRLPPNERGTIQAVITFLVAIWLLQTFGIIGGGGRH